MSTQFYLIVCLVITSLTTSQGYAAIGGIDLIGERLDLSEASSEFGRINPSVAYNNVDGQYLVTWSDWRNEPMDKSGWDVFGQRVSSIGSLVGSNLQIIQKPLAQIDSRVAYNPDQNNFLVSWRSQEGAETPPRTFNQTRARVVGHDGSLGTEQFIGFPAFEPTLVYNATQGDYFLTNRGFFDSPSGMKGWRLDETGRRRNAVISIASTGVPAPAGTTGYNHVHNEYLTTWRSVIDKNLKARRVSVNGELLGNEITVSDVFPSSPVGSRVTGVAYDSDNDRYLVAFGRFGQTGILGQFVGGNGALIGSEFKIRDTRSTGIGIQLAFDESQGTFVATWQEGLTSSQQVRIQALTDDGTLIGPSKTIDSLARINSQTALAYNSDNGEFLITWAHQAGTDLSTQEIFAQRFRVEIPEPGSAVSLGLTWAWMMFRRRRRIEQGVLQISGDPKLRQRPSAA